MEIGNVNADTVELHKVSCYYPTEITFTSGHFENENLAKVNNHDLFISNFECNVILNKYNNLMMFPH